MPQAAASLFMLKPWKPCSPSLSMAFCFTSCCLSKFLVRTVVLNDGAKISECSFSYEIFLCTYFVGRLVEENVLRGRIMIFLSYKLATMDYHNIIAKEILSTYKFFESYCIVLFRDEKNQIPIAIGTRAATHPSVPADTFSCRRRKKDEVFLR